MGDENDGDVRIVEEVIERSIDLGSSAEAIERESRLTAYSDSESSAPKWSESWTGCLGRPTRRLIHQQH